MPTVCCRSFTVMDFHEFPGTLSPEKTENGFKPSNIKLIKNSINKGGVKLRLIEDKWLTSFCGLFGTLSSRLQQCLVFSQKICDEFQLFFNMNLRPLSHSHSTGDWYFQRDDYWKYWFGQEMIFEDCILSTFCYYFFFSEN